MAALLRRLGVYLLAAWVALTVSFLLPRVVPGNPVAGAVARASQSGNCNEQCVLAIEDQLGYHVHTSLWVQYGQYWGNLVHGDLGHSWSENAPVSSLIVSYLPWTLGLLGFATILSFVGGTMIGTLVAWRRGSWTDWLMPAATFFQAVPYFFLAQVLALIRQRRCRGGPGGRGKADGSCPQLRAFRRGSLQLGLASGNLHPARRPVVKGPSAEHPGGDAMS